MKKAKWSPADIIIVGLEILAPIIAALTCFFPPFGAPLGTEAQLAFFSLGIVIPIVLLQFSVTQGQKKHDEDAERLNTAITQLQEQQNKNSDKLNTAIQKVGNEVTHLSPVLEKVMRSDNVLIERFACRRLEEVYNVIDKAVSSGRTSNLKPSEYYGELQHLASLITKDKTDNRDQFMGEVWAMTSFSKKEWVTDVTYEGLWIERLHELTRFGINTRRLCLISNELKRIISTKPFNIEMANNNDSFISFINFLKDYYGIGKDTKLIHHYIVNEKDDKELTAVKGFFAIRLTNGESHVIFGETVDETCLTGQVLFNAKEIKRVRYLFDTFSNENSRIEVKLPQMAGDNGFMEYLKSEGIEFKK